MDFLMDAGRFRFITSCAKGHNTFFEFKLKTNTKELKQKRKDRRGKKRWPMNQC